MFTFFDKLYKAWNAAGKHVEEAGKKQDAEDDARLIAAAQGITQARRELLAAEFAAALAANQHFVTLSSHMDYEDFVAQVMKLVNNEPRVLDINFHPRAANVFGIGSVPNMVTLVLGQKHA